MNQYREFFIGGPFDGMDKTEEFSTISFGIRFDELWTHEDYERNPGMDPELVGTVKTEWLYTPQRFTFGGIVIQFWADMRLMPREMVSLRLAELIMEPHIKQDKNNPPDEKTEMETPA